MRFILRASLALSAICFLNVIATAQTNKFTVQIVAAETQAEADATIKQLKEKGVEAYLLKSQVSGKMYYRVRAGSFGNASDARKYGETLKQQGYIANFFIAPYERPTPLNATLSLPITSKPEVNTAVAPSQTVAKESAAKEPIKSPSTVKDPIKEIVTNTGPKPEAPKTPTPTPVASSAVSSPPAVSFAQFRDSQIGFSLEYPAYWTGNPVSPDAAQAQNVNAGAYFQSVDDNAFMNVIWNEVSKANNPIHDNNEIVKTILGSMKSGKETQFMEATSQRVEEVKGQIKTFLEVKAKFQLPGQNAPLDFLGKTLIVRASKGILLVAVFYSKDAPAHVSGLVDRVLASVKTPE